MVAHEIVTKFRLTAAMAQKRIRELALNSGNVILGNHAKERMALRDIFREDVDRILRTGDVNGQPELTEFGEWKCKVVLLLKGRRTAGVVAVILEDRGKLFVKTVEWEDRL